MQITAHLKRWLTSVVALPLLILLIVGGGRIAFALLIGAVAIVALWEYYRIAGLPVGLREDAWLPLVGYVTAGGIVWGAFCGSFGAMLAFVLFDFFLTGLIALFRFGSDRGVGARSIKQVYGSIYVPVLVSSLVLIRNGADGIAWIFLLLGVIFAGDIAAYYVGSYWGCRKLCPAVSPGKTVEGALGGIVGNLVFGAIFKAFFLPGLPWGLGLLCFAALGLLGQGGDLFESQLKRSAGVKDSGTILPGHGGILDRIDALMFAAPLAFVFKEYLLR